MNKDQKKKKHPFFFLSRLFGGRKNNDVMNNLQEEALQSPMRTIIRKYKKNRKDREKSKKMTIA